MANRPNISLQGTLTLVDYIANRRPSGVGNVGTKSQPAAGTVSAPELRRWRGASRLANGQGVNCTPGVRRGAGQPVVQADVPRLQSDASVRLISCSAA
jgi:hypothetical protein